VALVTLGVAVLALAIVRVPDSAAVPAASTAPAKVLAATGEPEPAAKRSVDLRGTIRVIRGVSGLPALIAFSAFNNLLGGIFMALLDAYGLSLVSVQTWGLLWGALSTGFIVGGLLIARTGLGRNPVWVLLMVNLVLWAVTLIFPLRASIVWLTAGLYIYMLLVPYAEAAEQTILQKVVPYERQGRVFGFAQSVEQAASPLTAFLISPVAQFVFIPFMTDGAGARLIGDWFGTGANRGIALVFVLTGVVGVIATAVALRSRPYRRLSHRYAEQPAAVPS
jgi:DHA3 family multidrug efflux protein-like MFS transporter